MNNGKVQRRVEEEFNASERSVGTELLCNVSLPSRIQLLFGERIQQAGLEGELPLFRLERQEQEQMRALNYAHLPDDQRIDTWRVCFPKSVQHAIGMEFEWFFFSNDDKFSLENLRKSIVADYIEPLYDSNGELAYNHIR